MDSGTTSFKQLPISNQLNNNNNNNSNNNIVLTKNEMPNNLNIPQAQAQAQPQPQMQMQQQNQPQPQMQMQMQQQSQQQQQGAINSNNYNELITQIQNASEKGFTNLPSRDIPNDENHITSDENIKPNFIPKPETISENYIENNESINSVINENIKRHNFDDNLEFFYNQFQLPLIIVILYFLFQLPVFRKLIRQIFPGFISGDGNFNIYGQLFNSLLFGIIFYLLIKLINGVTNYL